MKEMDITQDQKRALENEISDHFGFDVEVDSVQDFGNKFTAFVSYDDPKTSKAKHRGVKFQGNFKAHSIEDFKIMEDLTEKVHTLSKPGIKPKGSPKSWDRARAFDKVNPKTGKRPDRSVLKNYNPQKGKYHAIESSDEKDFIMVLVMGDGKEFSYGKDHEKDPWTEYYGVNVLFFPDGKVDASTGDLTSKQQWAKDKDKIIAAAKTMLKNKDLPTKGRKQYESELKSQLKNMLIEMINDRQDQVTTLIHDYIVAKTSVLVSSAEQSLMSEANEDKLYTANAYGNGFDRAAVRKGEILPTGDGDEVEFIRIDGKKLVVKVDGKEKLISPNDVLGVIKLKGEKPTDADFKKITAMVLGEGKKSPIGGIKIGGVSTEKPQVGFEDRLNFHKAQAECQDAGIKFKTTSKFGVHYMIFDNEADQKKAVRLIKKVIDKSMESAW